MKDCDRFLLGVNVVVLIILLIIVAILTNNYNEEIERIENCAEKYDCFEYHFCMIEDSIDLVELKYHEAMYLFCTIGGGNENG